MAQLLQIPTSAIPVVHQHERPTGLLEGTRIETSEGPRNVEMLLGGDTVRNRDGSFVELRGTSVMIACNIDVVEFWPQPQGETIPDGPLLCVPAMQQILADDWRAQVLYESASLPTPAGSLVDGLRVRRERRALVRLFRLHFDSPQLIMAGGFAVASEKTRAPVPFGATPDDLFMLDAMVAGRVH